MNPARCLLGAVALFVPAAVPAGGFQISELCARCQGQRNAGMAAATDSAAAGYFNPAAPARLEAPGAELSAHYIYAAFEFQDRGSSNAFGRPLPGETRNDGAVPAWVPNLHAATPLGRRFGIGISVTAPYGLITEYDDDWVGRYHALKSDLQTINVNPTLSWNLTDSVSIGAGAVWQRAEAELTNAVDFGALARVVLPQSSPFPIPPELLPDSGDFALDGLTRLDGDDESWGWTAGLLYQGERTRLGVGYRSAIDHTLKGAVTTTLPPEAAELAGTERIVRAGAADITTPQSVTLGLQHDIHPQWTLLFGATWTDWSAFESIEVVDPAGAVISLQPEDWNDSWRYSAGFEYAYDPAVVFRLGVEYDATPVPADRLTARIPDEDRYWLATGVTWRVSRRLLVDFAWTHIWAPSYEIDDTELTTGDVFESLTGVNPGIGNSLRGDYDAEADILSIGVRWGY